MKYRTLFFKNFARCLAFAAAGCLIAGTCSICFAGLTEPDVLVSIADKGIEPSLDRSANAGAGLEQAVRQLCENPGDAALKNAREKWHAAYLAWCEALPFMVGSTADAERKIGAWSANKVVLDAAVMQDDLTHLLKNKDTRGFSAVEHMLFAPKDAKAATAGGRCSHLRNITSEIAELTARAADEWKKEKSGRFKLAGNADPFLLPADALSLVLARILNVTEVMLRDRIGLPSNYFQTPTRPDYFEAWESRTTRDAFRATIKGIRLAVVGDETTGLTRLVATKDGLYESKDPGLARDIKKQLDKIEARLSDMADEDLDFHARVKDKPGFLKKFYKETNKLQEQIVEAALVLELDVRSGLESQLSE